MFQKTKNKQIKKEIAIYQKVTRAKFLGDYTFPYRIRIRDSKTFF